MCSTFVYLTFCVRSESPRTILRRSPRQSPRKKLGSSFDDLMRYALMDCSRESCDIDDLIHGPAETTSAPSSQSQSLKKKRKELVRGRDQVDVLIELDYEVEEDEEEPEELGEGLADLEDFLELFKKPGSDKIPKPIVRLKEWYAENRDKMWIARTADGHLELTYDRPSLIRKFAQSSEAAENKLEVARKTVQNFERCLNSVKPKLIVLESTHGKNLKRVGFQAPEEIFGSARTSVPKKVERQQIRREKRETRPTKRRALEAEYELDV